MQSLLSPAESHAFQSFLSSIDYPDAESVSISASEWALYNSSAPMYSSQDDPLLEAEGNPEHREALTKATKDLMSLDSDNWETGTSMMDHPGMPHQRQAFNANGQIINHYDQQHEQRMLVHQQQVMQHQQHHQHPQQRHNSFSTTHDLFPFLHSKVQQQRPPELQYPQHPMQQHLPVSPMNTDHSSPTSPHLPFNFPQQHNSMALHHPPPQQQQVHISLQPQQQRGLSSVSAARNKRVPTSRPTPALETSSRSTLQSSSSALNAKAASSSSSSSQSNGFANGTRQNGVDSKRPRSSTSPTTQQEGPSTAPKQTLLSPSQKKANHIQSEQKRRANIRRGYEALCETVPALREAIREEDEAERNGSSVNGAGQRKKSRGKKNGKEGSDEREKDRLDGRAGPRSENVVLSKTIDHIQALLADRSALLARLHHARSSLPPGHPALTPLMPDPPWEREWKGGEGRLGDEDPDGEGASDGEEEGEEE